MHTVPDDQSLDEIIQQVQKQKSLKFLLAALLGPIPTLAQKGAAIVASGGRPVTDEEYIEALIVRILRRYDLLPEDKATALAHSIKISRDKRSPIHPYWMPLY